MFGPFLLGDRGFEDWSQRRMAADLAVEGVDQDRDGILGDRGKSVLALTGLIRDILYASYRPDRECLVKVSRMAGPAAHSAS
jgi:hypothetical protein